VKLPTCRGSGQALRLARGPRWSAAAVRAGPLVGRLLRAQVGEGGRLLGCKAKRAKSGRRKRKAFPFSELEF